MRPRTADRRRDRRLLWVVIVVAVLGVLGVVAAGEAETSGETVVVVALLVIAVVGVLAWQQRADRRDQGRVDVYITRLLDMDDDPEIDPQTDR
jgi:undecaprenyl pyrophosphate phosphatase UppP